MSALRAEPVDPLGALLERAQRGSEALRDPHADGAASVTFVLLTPRALSEGELDQLTRAALNGALMSASTLIKRAGLTEALKPKALIKALSVNTLPVDASFPFNIDALTASARDAALTARAHQNKGALMISYRGAPLKAGAQLALSCHATLAALQALGEEERASTLPFSLEALSYVSQEALKERCEAVSQAKPSAGSLEAWVRPDLESFDEGQLLFVSRGLAQFGRAELEFGPLKRAEARPLWSSFVTGVLSSVSEPPSQTLKRAPCVRPEHAYEGRCTRVIPEGLFGPAPLIPKASP